MNLRFGTPEERFWRRVEKTDGCWLWTGTVSSVGYGMLFISKRQSPVTTHRFSYELHNGEIPAGRWVLHRCDVRNCVNPAHLFLGNALDNTRDMVEKGRGRFGDHLKARTHCKRGHEYTPENTSYHKPAPNTRKCKACAREGYYRGRATA